jgi:hypothetical protein
MQIVGNLFKQGAIKVAIRGALDVTAVKAKKWVQQDTPVDTGKLRDSYFTKSLVSKESVQMGNSAKNPQGTFYFPFVENGTRFFTGRFMYKRNVPRIEAEMKRNLANFTKYLR